MGCISSKSSILTERDQYTNSCNLPNRGFLYPARSEKNLRNINIYFIDDIGVISRPIASQYFNPDLPVQSFPSGTALFGEYRCTCGRTWSSRLSWQGNYQKCKRCKRSVYPHAQRQLRPSDMSADKENTEHAKELCQKCELLGSHCGKQQRDAKPYRRARHSSLSMF